MLQFPLLVTFMAMLVALCITADDMYRCDDGTFTCTKQVAYVCASNGISYLNHCEFFNAYCNNNEISFKHDGKCEDNKKAAAPAPSKQSKDYKSSTAAPTTGYSPVPATSQPGTATYNAAAPSPAPAKSAAITSSMTGIIVVAAIAFASM